MQQFHKFITWCLCVAQHVSGTIRSLQLHLDPPVLPLESAGWSVVSCRLARPRPTTLQPALSNSKTGGSLVQLNAPDDGRGDARNMLSHTWTSSNKLVELLHLVGWFIWIEH